MCRDVKGKITRNLVLDCFTLLWFPPVLVIINIFVVQIPPPPPPWNQIFQTKWKELAV